MVTNGIRAIHWTVCQRGRWVPKGGGLLSHIGWIGEQNIRYKGVETSSYQTCFKTLRGSSEEKTQRGQYLLAVGLGSYKWYQSHRAVC